MPNFAWRDLSIFDCVFSGVCLLRRQKQRDHRVRTAARVMPCACRVPLLRAAARVPPRACRCVRAIASPCHRVRACRRVRAECVRAAACVPPRVSACMPPRAYVPSPACRCVRARGVACVPPRVCHHVACRRVRAASVLCTFRRSVPPVRAAACRRACRRVRACRGLVDVGSLESGMGNVNARYAVVALSGQHGRGTSLMSANRNLSPTSTGLGPGQRTLASPPVTPPRLPLKRKYLLVIVSDPNGLPSTQCV